MKELHFDSMKKEDKRFLIHQYKVLDVGCGGGDFANAFIKSTGIRKISGIDPLNVCGLNVHNEHVKVKLRSIEIEQLIEEVGASKPENKNLFDLVCCGELINHV